MFEPDADDIERLVADVEHRRLEILERDLDHFVGALLCEADGTANGCSRALMEMFLVRHSEMSMGEAKELIKRLFK
jgi:hypothetical protein